MGWATDDKYAHADPVSRSNLDHPAWYFLVEMTVFNLVLAYALIRQNQLCRLFLPEIESLA